MRGCFAGRRAFLPKQRQNVLLYVFAGALDTRDDGFANRIHRVAGVGGLRLGGRGRNRQRQHSGHNNSSDAFFPCKTQNVFSPFWGRANMSLRRCFLSDKRCKPKAHTNRRTDAGSFLMCCFLPVAGSSEAYSNFGRPVKWKSGWPVPPVFPA